ncbi:MAG: hypothetical protein MMC33_002629 [Icmadophila ericetorum]|nr:hypothetical protein [Icmadophila ericetorum]
MKLSLSLAAIITLLGLVAAHEPSKQVIVSYPQDTPDSVITQAMNALIAAGGIITHEYTLIKGFAATASVEALNAIQVLSSAYPATVEEDQIVTIQESPPE